MKITFAAPKLPDGGTIVTGVAANKKLSPTAAALDKRSGGALKRAISASRFEGKRGQLLDVLAPANLNNDRILLVGLGDPKDVKLLDLEELGGTFSAHLAKAGVSAAVVAVDDVKGAAFSAAERAARGAYGACLRAYRFSKYRTKEATEDKPSLARLTFQVAQTAAARRAFAPLGQIADGVFTTRDLVSEPANIIYPATLAAEGRKLAKLGLKVQVLGEAQMKKLGMGALLGVGQGSVQESKLLIMRWDGDPSAKGAKRNPVAFVGKGVTFDTGGISLKPAAGMEEMKWDMGGAGVVVGLMHALAARKAKVNAVGICGLVENMPSGNAQRPGDIVTSMSGQTIEVLNTDAEGRLVLADALWYTQEKFKPRAIVDLATLTGAVIVSLGHEYAGLFSNNDALCDQLTAAGDEVGEPVWRLPMGEAYDKQINCDVADMKNIGGNRAGGSITAAQFLLRFVKGDTPWAHLDIAGVAWSSKDKPIVPKGGTGFGVRLLDRLVAANYEG